MFAQKIEPSEVQYVIASSTDDVKVENNTMVSFMTREAVVLNGIEIPKLTVFYAVAEFNDGRIYFNVEKINLGTQDKPKVHNVNLSIVGSDYKEGLLNIGGKNMQLPQSTKLTFKVNEIEK